MRTLASLRLATFPLDAALSFYVPEPSANNQRTSLPANLCVSASWIEVEHHGRQEWADGQARGDRAASRLQGRACF
eukprot:scaffold24227_cov30-Tisochrysis_lutea.AAC.2